MSAAEILLDRQAEATADSQEPPGRLIRFADVPRLKWLPRRRGGARLSKPTLHRWRDPARPVHLRSVRVGGCWCTTEQWLRDFFEELAAEPSTPTTPARTPARRARAVAAAEAELKAAGILR